MKTRKVLSFATAAVMALASLPVLSVSAEDVLLGDVDQDGVITGHDSAMVSRHLYDDTYSLSDEQLALADVNGDGVVDQTDLEWIHENEVYIIGQYDVESDDTLNRPSMGGAWLALHLYGCISAGAELDLVQTEALHQFEGNPDAEYEKVRSWVLNGGTVEVSEVQYNVLDSNADGSVDIYDAYNLLLNNSYFYAGASYYPIEGRYDLMNNAPRVVE